MPLNKEARIEKIKLLEGKFEAVGAYKIEWDGKTEYRNVYRVPISYLVYNKYNGRILSRIKSLETQNQKINIEIEKDFKMIEKLLFDSHPTRNRQTEKSIKEKGQEKPGIITKDGVVIDGNRRFMSLNRLIKSETGNTEKFKYFEAVILPVSLADDPNQIMKLETNYQMGEDKKLDYNPIEKYLRVQELKNSQISKKDISSWMSETEVEINKYLDTMEIMDDYLDYLKCQGIYTQLDGREDWLLSLTRWLKIFRGDKSIKAFDGYKNEDVDDLQLVCYDYIRAKHGGDGKRFRKIAEGLKSNHIFGNEDLWYKFKNLHFDKIEPILDNEINIDYNSNDLKSHLDDRDKKFTENSEEFLKDNLNDRISELSNKQNHDKPEKLINKANGALQEINLKADSFLKPDTQKQLIILHDKVTKLVSENDIFLVLQQVLKLLECIEIENLDDKNNSSKLDIITKINKLSFDIKKQLGG